MTTRQQFVAVLATVFIAYTAGFSLLSLLMNIVP